jgi:hypothetical protein
MGQYEDSAWLTKAESKSRTIHSRFGSWEKASTAVGVSHNTLRSWARGDTSPNASQQTKMNRMVGQYRSSEKAMKTITETSVRQDRIANRRTIRVEVEKGNIPKWKGDADLKATPLVTKAEAERVSGLLARARESGNEADWKVARNSYNTMIGQSKGTGSQYDT